MSGKQKYQGFMNEFQHDMAEFQREMDEFHRDMNDLQKQMQQQQFEFASHKNHMENVRRQQEYIREQIHNSLSINKQRIDMTPCIYYRDVNNADLVIKGTPDMIQNYFGRIPKSFKLGSKEFKMIVEITHNSMAVIGDDVNLVNGKVRAKDLYEFPEAVKFLGESNIVDEQPADLNSEDKNDKSLYELKHKLKVEQKAKNKRKFKWIIGNHYILKRKGRDGGKPLIWEYELIKYVYSIGTCPMNSLIVKKISGPDELIYSISPSDCKRLHIKYQNGLEIMSMDTEGLMPKKIKK